MRVFGPLFMLVLFAGSVSGQTADLAAIFEHSAESVAFLLFDQEGDDFGVYEAFKARSIDLAQDHSHLLVAGDFTGDGVDELAAFGDLEYTPNLNPAFTCSIISVSRSNGKQFVPAGTWFSTLKTDLDFSYVSFSVAGDYNLDGLDDIVLFYNDPSLDQLNIYMLESTGSGFTAAQSWYTVDRVEFNFTALKFACQADFNDNGKPDIAVFYNYFGTAPETKQSVFIFESEGDSFSLLPVAYDASKASCDFSSMKFALPGDYNLDGYSDIAVLQEDPDNQDLIITVFEGAVNGQVTPRDYASYVDSEPFLSSVLHAVTGNLVGDTASDLALFYDNPGTGLQEILVLESEITGFKAPVTKYSANLAALSVEDITAVRSGVFISQPLVTVATWKDDRKGALSFTFDDGYRGAFEQGGAELEAAGLKGTFYIFTDTSVVYDGELASTGLVRAYKDMGHEIGSHTVNHSDLGLLTGSGDFDSLNQVLSLSAELLNERFDQHTLSMSIPFGSFRFETLDYISHYFFSARSSQFGFNLPTPYDFFALKSWPVLSTTTPAYLNTLLTIAENYGTYLPLMYHDILDEPFDEDILIYTYSRDLLRETIQDALHRDLWIDTHQRIYKYIRERNALKILYMDSDDLDIQPGHFSFEADDGLPDSIFDVQLTLRIAVPGSWTADTLTIDTRGEWNYMKVQQDSTGSYIYFDWLPASGLTINVYEGRLPGTGIQDRTGSSPELSLVAAPNPFHHETFIRVKDGNMHSDAYLIVRDLQGRIVQEISEPVGPFYRLAGEHLPPGVYIIQLIDSGKPIASLKLLSQ